MLADLMLPAPTASAAPTAPTAPTAAVSVLHAWDERRAAAWSAGDVAGLRALYTPDAAAGRADATMLRAWVRRGLRVERMQMQLLRVEVRRASPRRLELTVTDRLARSEAVGPGWRRTLPRDEPSTRWVTLVRAAGQWRVAQARWPASPARTTS